MKKDIFLRIRNNKIEKWNSDINEYYIVSNWFIHFLLENTDYFNIINESGNIIIEK